MSERPLEQILDELEEAMLCQEEAIAYRDFDSFDRNALAVKVLCDSIRSTSPINDACRSRLDALGDRTRRLCLNIAQQKQDVANRMQRLRSSKRAMRSYSQFKGIR